MQYDLRIVQLKINIYACAINCRLTRWGMPHLDTVVYVASKDCFRKKQNSICLVDVCSQMLYAAVVFFCRGIVIAVAAYVDASIGITCRSVTRPRFNLASHDEQGILEVFTRSLELTTVDKRIKSSKGLYDTQFL